MPRSSESRERGDIVARMPGRRFGLGGAIDLLQDESLWETLPSAIQLQEADPVGRWLIMFGASRKWSHQENLASAQYIQGLYRQIEDHVVGHGTNIDAVFDGKVRMDVELERLFQAYHMEGLRLAQGNIRLLRTAFAKTTLGFNDLPGELTSDVFAAGYEGLFSAAKRFDPWKNSEGDRGDSEWAGKFSTFAVQTSFGRMMRELYSQDVIRIPYNANSDLKAYYQAGDYYARREDVQLEHHELVVAAIYYRQHSAIPSLEHLKELVQQARENKKFHSKVERFSDLLASQSIGSIDKAHQVTPQKPVGEETGEPFDVDSGEIIDDTSDVPTLVEQLMRDNAIRQALKEGPTPRERWAIQLYFGLEDGHQYILEEVGRKLGVTRERARQIVETGLSKLRHPHFRRELRDYVLD